MAVGVACIALYLFQALKREPVSSFFSTDWTLFFASAVPDCRIDLNEKVRRRSRSKKKMPEEEEKDWSAGR